MKEVLIILDGLMEQALETFDFKTLVLGDLPVVCDIKSVDFSVKNKPLDSLHCIFNMLGYNANTAWIGERAYYEGLSKGIQLNDHEVILRCNIVKCCDGKLIDFTGGNLPSHIGEILSEIQVPEGKLIPMDTYKNLLILNNSIADHLYPPHFYLGEKVVDLLPKSKELQQLIKNSATVFNNHDLQGCILWPWGLSQKVELELFKHKHQKSAGIISGIELVSGMGIALGMNSIIPPGCTGYQNTNLSHKLNAAVKMLKEVDVLIVHINGLDELAHQKDWVGKLAFLERIKKEFLIPFIEQAGPCQINITCDHVTDSKTGNHEMGEVPLLRFENKKKMI